MDLFSFAPIAAVLDIAYQGVEHLAALLSPLTGGASAAIAIVVLTVLVRGALVPVGISQVKAEWNRRRLAPRLQALQRRYTKNPQLLQQKTLELYREEKASPFAGMLPALAQAPVLSFVYALFVRSSVDGHANALLGQHLFGVPLGTSFVHLAGSAAAWPGILVYLVLFALLGVTAWATRRTTLRLALPQAGPLPGLTHALSWLPFITIVFAAIVPLAATLYLTTTTAWTLGERALLRRRYWRPAGAAPVPAVAGRA